MRRIVLPLSLIVVGLAGFAAWSFVLRPAGTRVAPAISTVAPVATASLLRDTAAETWRLTTAPVVIPERPSPTRRVVAEPALDWSTLSAGVAAAGPNPATATLALATPSPAELDIAMTARERRALIASAREPDSPPGPRGYRPGIAVIIPGGSSSDGVCR